MRRLLTALFLVVGIGLAGVSFYLAMPPSHLGSSPKMPYAAGMFVAGVIIAFLGPVVFEVLPSNRRNRN